MVTYAFEVKGCYLGGTKAKMTGRIKAEDGYPMEAFNRAARLCELTTPGLIVGDGAVTLRKLKARRVKRLA